MALESHIDSPAASHEQSIAIYTTPSPFNSLLWRIVVLRGDDYLEGYYSFLDSDRPIEFDAYPKNNELFAQVKNIWAAKRLDWFAQGFIKSSMVDDYLVISDLRMGFADNYAFNHAVARMGNPHYHEIESILLPSQLRAEDLPLVWNRLLGKE
jgi:inner membrane protein